jgi:RimJ/RimL family protein N-acetyltransferase
MCRELVALAQTAEPGVTITAQTLPARDASTRVLEKCGFRWHSEFDHPEDGRIWEWWLVADAGTNPPAAPPAVSKG